MSQNIDSARGRIQAEALQALRNSNFRGSAIIPTGGGKTRVMVMAAQELVDSGKVETVLYTCDNQRLRDIDFRAEVLKWGSQELLDRMELMCYQSACKLKDKHYDLLLADEADFSITPAFSRLYTQNHFKHKILVTGTVTPEKRDFINKVAPIVYEKSIGELEQAGVLNKTKYFKVAYMLSTEENKQYVSFQKQFSKAYEDKKQSYVDYLIKKRRHFLCNLESCIGVTKAVIRKVYWPDMKLLVFGQSQAILDATLPDTYHTGNQKNRNIDRFNNGEIPALGLIGKADRGVNFTCLPNTVIYQAPTASKTKFLQKNGRLKRLSSDTLAYAFFLVPYYQEKGSDGQLITKPTVVDRWVDQSLSDSNVIFEYFQL